MSWIEIIPQSEASGKLRDLYDRVRGAGGAVDNILQVHSLRPHTLTGHLGLYKSVLHHGRNRLSRWLLETIGVYVSLLNGCQYCVDHHLAGLRRLLDDDDRAAAIRRALEAEAFEAAFDERETAILGYARTLTRDPAAVRALDVDAMRSAGLDDGEILEVNQVVSYFAYANRTVLGLGVTTEGDVLGLSPSNVDDADDWQHR